MGGVRPELLRIATSHYPGSRLEPMTGDASTRQFLRLHLGGGGSRVLMDYGETFDTTTDDVRLARVFEAAQLPVASIEQVWPDPGCLVLEDLGDDLLEARPELLPQAVRLAAEIAHRGTAALLGSERATGPALDSKRFRFEMDFFIEHYAGSLLGRGSLPESLSAALHHLADRAAEGPRVLCHRDYHSRNLLVLDDERLAMVDIQDARWGPDSYDLASLLRDAYTEIPEASIDPMIDLYLANLEQLGTTPDRDGFRRRFAICSAQRMIKALGTFGYQVGVRSRDRYRDAIPRTLGRLRRALPASEATAGLLPLLDQAGLLDQD